MRFSPTTDSKIEIFFRKHRRSSQKFFEMCLSAAGISGKPYLCDHTKATQWCAAMAKNLMERNAEFRAFANRFAPAPLFTVGQQLANSVCFWTDYGLSRTVYSVDEQLWQDLSNTRFPAKFPSSYLRVPKMAFIVEAPIGTRETQRYLMVHVNVYDGAEGKNLGLRILEFDNRYAFDGPWSDDGGNLPLVLRSVAVLSLGETTLGEAWDDFEARSAKVGMTAEEAKEQLARDLDLARGVINLLLFMQSGRDAVPMIDGDPIPKLPAGTGRKADKKARQWDIGRHSVIHVGPEYGEAVRTWMRDGGAIESGHGVKPHLRSAHCHLYWTGRGSTIPEVKFLAPIRVKSNPGSDNEAKAK